jgi:hypothetical protein
VSCCQSSVVGMRSRWRIGMAGSPDGAISRAATLATGRSSIASATRHEPPTSSIYQRGFLPNIGEFLTPGPNCRSSFGEDAMRQLIIFQKFQ